MSGKTCIVTGANSGIGQETALGLAQAGARVVLVCRSETRGNEALRDIRQRSGSDSLELVCGDLASQQSIRDLAETLLERCERIDVLVNNAAIVPPQREETEDGIEMQFGVNHLGPFLLTNLLLDRIRESAPARIVNVASTVHLNGSIHFDDLEYATHKYSAMSAYAQSKLANVLFTRSLAQRLEGFGVTTNCLHPGVVRTGIARHAPLPLRALMSLVGLVLLSPSKGAATSLYLAMSPEVENVTGEYFDKCAVARSSTESKDMDIAERLWAVSAEMTGLGD